MDPRARGDEKDAIQIFGMDTQDYRGNRAGSNSWWNHPGCFDLHFDLRPQGEMEPPKKVMSNGPPLKFI